MADIETQLVHCIYASASTKPLSEADFMDILQSARRNNEQLGVTGMLLYEDGSFFQVLEGEADTVNELYQKIARDLRHDKIAKIVQEPITKRSFAEWTMGYSGVSRDDLQAIEGLNDFFLNSRCFTELDQGRAKVLLSAFQNGQWRTSLS